MGNFTSSRLNGGGRYGIVKGKLPTERVCANWQRFRFWVPGGFGVSLAATCYKYGHQVTLWGLFPDEVNAIIRDGEHKKLLPGVPVNPGIRVTADIGEAAGADLLILAVPSFAVRETAARAKPILGEKTVVVSVAKGAGAGHGGSCCPM